MYNTSELNYTLNCLLKWELLKYLEAVFYYHS